MALLEKVSDLINDWKRKDIDAVLEYLSDDIVYYYAIGEAPIIGKEAFRGFLTSIKDHQRNTEWRIKRSAETDTTLFVEGIDDYTNPEGHHIIIPHMTIYEFRDGKISAWRDYFDFGLLKRTEAGEPVSENLQSLINS